MLSRRWAAIFRPRKTPMACQNSLMLAIRCCIAALAWLLLCDELMAQEAEVAADQRAASLTRLKKAAEEYTITLGTDKSRLVTLVEAPVLRFSDPVSSVPDGALFLWTNDGCPAAAAAFWSNTAGREWVEFQSLSLSPLIATRFGKDEWTPR